MRASSYRCAPLRIVRCWMPAIASLVLVGFAAGGDLTPTGVLQIVGALPDNEQISGIAVSADAKLLFLVADEQHHVLVLKQSGSDERYEFVKGVDILSPETDDDEADLEGLAIEGKWLYVVGSHSAKRDKLEPTASRKRNRNRLKKMSKEKGRRQLLRLRVDTVLDESPELERFDLWKDIKANETLEPFTDVPSKENGIDIEGLAVDGGRFLIGFRSPVLRGGFGIVMKTKLDESSDSSLLFLDLRGNGIRDMAPVAKDHSVLLCGPSGDIAGTYALKLWNGKDATPGDDAPSEPAVIDLGVIPPPQLAQDAKAEGVAILKQEAEVVELVIVYDGAENGAPTKYRINLPGRF